ncbi:DUF3566 domain-containing protein [Actinotalea sp. K2]|uniref:DUF3566 domain-containing protein n=1 Tax=Actinotalea sp. K2 TaxID=2939438 RepID=UPI002016A79A|nr:DUF3566 domain-containing protein [Actinotalea sp. K2]MCL3860765.1 DUF3566 domain-containing protein [Actinotalea sp. K2]
MSTDGTKPPSIAPKKPAGSSAGGPGTRTDTSTRAQPAGSEGPTTGAKAPAPKTPPAPRTPATTKDTTSTDASGSGPSVTDRLKKAASGAAESARKAMPSRDEGPSTGRTSATDRPPSTDHAGTARSTTTTTGPAPAAAPSGPRRVRLAVSKVDPWSVMKLSFLLSVAIGIMIVVAAAVTWYALDALAVFTQVNDVIATLTGDETYLNLLDYVGFERVVSLATMIAVVDVVLLTALSTIGAFLYNITAALVGGIHLTLTDD